SASHPGREIEMSRARPEALAELGDVAVNLTVQPRRVGHYQTRRAARPPTIKPDYRQGEAVATRQAYRRALGKLGALDSEIGALGTSRTRQVPRPLRSDFRTVSLK